MAESTLSEAYSSLRKQVGRFVGYGGDSASWSVSQGAELDDILTSGLRQFYCPPPLADGAEPHQWSFLRPTTTQVTVADTYQYTLPDNFGAVIGEMTFATTDYGVTPLKQVSEQSIRDMRQGGTPLTGYPRYYSVQGGATAGSTGQRFTLSLYPTPNAVYTLTYRYAVLMDAITSGSPYPMGGEMHAETILESCLAIAEQRMDDETGLHTAKFKERLAASIAADRQLAPKYFGYNGDRSGNPSEPFSNVYVSINGSVPGL